MSLSESRSKWGDSHTPFSSLCCVCPSLQYGAWKKNGCNKYLLNLNIPTLSGVALNIFNNNEHIFLNFIKMNKYLSGF